MRNFLGIQTKSERIADELPSETVKGVHTDARELAEETTYEEFRTAIQLGQNTSRRKRTRKFAMKREIRWLQYTPPRISWKGHANRRTFNAPFLALF